MNFKTLKENILFLDIETVSLYKNYSEVSEVEQELFANKTVYKRGENVSPEEFYSNAGIWAEFGKIVCISVGYFVNHQLRITSFASKDEEELLLAFKNVLTTHFNQPKHLMCGHNAKELYKYIYI